MCPAEAPEGTAMHAGLTGMHIAQAGRLGSGPALGPECENPNTIDSVRRRFGAAFTPALCTLSSERVSGRPFSSDRHATT